MLNVILTREQRLAVDRRAIEVRRITRASIPGFPCRHTTDCDCWEFGR